MQLEVAQHAGVSRKVVVNVEAGQVSLENLIAILIMLDLIGQLELFGFRCRDRKITNLA